MSDDRELIDLYLDKVADKFTAEELVELLELDVWDIIEFYQEQILENHWIKEALEGNYK